MYTSNPSKSKICTIHQIWKAQNKSRFPSFSVAGDSLTEWPGFLSSSTFYKALSEGELSFINEHRNSIERTQSSHTTCSSVRLAVLAKKNENFTCYGSAVGKRLLGAGTGTSAFDREVNEWKPAIMRIMLGTNEIYAGVSLSDYEATLRDVLDELMHKHGVIPILFTIPPAIKGNKIAMSIQVNNIIKRVGKELEVLVYDFGSKIGNSAVSRDGVHLTQDGQKEHVSSTIRAFYKVLPLLDRCS